MKYILSLFLCICANAMNNETSIGLKDNAAHSDLGLICNALQDDLNMYYITYIKGCEYKEQEKHDKISSLMDRYGQNQNIIGNPNKVAVLLFKLKILYHIAHAKSVALADLDKHIYLHLFMSGPFKATLGDKVAFLPSNYSSKDLNNLSQVLKDSSEHTISFDTTWLSEYTYTEKLISVDGKWESKKPEDSIPTISPDIVTQIQNKAIKIPSNIEEFLRFLSLLSNYNGVTQEIADNRTEGSEATMGEFYGCDFVCTDKVFAIYPISVNRK